MKNIQLIGRSALAGLLAMMALLVTSQAQAQVTVTAVQPPAWLERQGTYQALMPGVELLEGDALVTGGGGRIVVDMGVLGELKQSAGTRLTLQTLDTTGNPAAPATIDVEAGAMNLNYRVGGSAAGPVTVSLKEITVLLNQADTVFSGETEGDIDIACALRGSLQATNAGQIETVNGSDKCYIQPLGGDEERIIKEITPEQAGMVAAITSINNDRPVIRTQGSWVVNLASFKQESDAREFLEMIYTGGYPAQVAQVDVNGQTWNRISVGNFSDKSQADRYKNLIQEAFGATSAWVTKR